MNVGFNHNLSVSSVSLNKQNNINKNYLQSNNVDTVSFSGKNSSNKDEGLSEADKQKLLKSARTSAAGWSILGSFISTLYYSLRADSTVADKYDLDKEKDKDFIKEIKRQQTIQTIPSIFFWVGGIAAWGYNILKNPENIKVD